MKTTLASLRLPAVVCFMTTGLPGQLLAGIQEKENGAASASLDTSFGVSFFVAAAGILAVICVGGYFLKKVLP